MNRAIRAARGLVVVLFAGVFLGAPRALGDETENPLEPADTSSPRATLNSFLKASGKIYALIRTPGQIEAGSANLRHAVVVERLLRCLDMSQEPDYLRDHIARETAVCLKEVLDRIELPPDSKIPGGETVVEGAELEELDKWAIPGTEITIARVKEGPRAGEYLFSPATVSRATEFYQRVEHLPYRTDGPAVTPGFYDWFLSEPGWMLTSIVRSLPRWARRHEYGQTVWQWIGLVITVLLALSLMLFAYIAGRWRARTMRKEGVFRYLVTLWFPIAAMLIPLLAREFIANQIRISGVAHAIVEFSANVFFLLAALVVLVSVGNRVAEVIISSPRIHSKGLDAQFIRITCRVLSLVAAIIVFLEGGRYLGIPLTTLLAGAGVGGLTVALAAQDTLKNLFGSMMIILDRPYRVGERIIVKGHDGTVEEIGLRSTKIRLLTGHMTSIPNEEMARSDIENVGRRIHIRRKTDIAIPLDIPAEKAEEAVQIVRRILDNHEGMKPDYPPRVYLNEFNRDSLNLRMFYWYHPPNYWDFLAMSEKVNMRIKRDFAAAGIAFALPTATTFMAQDSERPLELKVVNKMEGAKK